MPCYDVPWAEISVVEVPWQVKFLWTQDCFCPSKEGITHLFFLVCQSKAATHLSPLLLCFFILTHKFSVSLSAISRWSSTFLLFTHIESNFSSLSALLILKSLFHWSIHETSHLTKSQWYQLDYSLKTAQRPPVSHVIFICRGTGNKTLWCADFQKQSLFFR